MSTSIPTLFIYLSFLFLFQLFLLFFFFFTVSLDLLFFFSFWWFVVVLDLHSAISVTLCTSLPLILCFDLAAMRCRRSREIGYSEYDVAAILFYCVQIHLWLEIKSHNSINKGPILYLRNPFAFRSPVYILRI